MRISSGKIESAQKCLVYGPEGIGKSTFAAQFPEPLFIDVEGSTKHMDVRRLDTPVSWTMLMEEVAFVVTNPSVCRTLVIDTADWAEQLCIAHVCAKAQKDGIEDFGYGKGYTYLAEEFGKLLNRLTEAVERGVNVVLTAHAQIKKFEQPDEMAAYDRWELKLQKKTAPLVKEWCDMVLFANYETFAVKDSKTEKVTGQGGKRVLHTSHAPTWDAKNRHDFDDKLPFEFVAIAHAIPAGLAPKADMSAEVSEPVDPPQIDSSPPADDVPIAEDSGRKEGPGPVHMPLHLAQLEQLMEEAKVSEADVRAAVASKGYFPEATPIDKYPPDFVQGCLIAAWDGVIEIIHSSRQTSLGVK